MKKSPLTFSILILFYTLENPLWSQTVNLTTSPENIVSPSSFVEALVKKSPGKLELLEESNLDRSFCQECQTHVNLSADVIEILQQIESDTLQVHPIEQARLQSLYFNVKKDETNKTIDCFPSFSLNDVNPDLQKRKLSFVSEEIFEIPNIEEILISPFINDQIIYTFREDGIHRDRFLELIVAPDGKSKLRTYRYISETDPQDEKTALMPNQKFDPANIRLLDNGVTISIDSNAQSLKSDKASLIANPHHTRLDKAVSSMTNDRDDQSNATQITITENQGRPWMILSAESSSDLTQHELVTAAPLSLMIDSQSRLRINSTLKSEVQLSRIEETIALDHAQGASLDLSNDEHLFVGVEVYQRDSDRYNRIAVYNDFQIGSASTLGSRFENDNNGNSVFSIASTTELTNHSNLKFEAGQSNASVFMTVRTEHQLGDKASISLGAGNSSERKQEFILQFKAKF